MNILFTCAGRRTYLLNYFKEALAGDGLIIGADLQLSAPALSVADVKLQVPRVYAPDYVDVILSICKEYEVKVLISLNDLELPILSNNKARFEDLDVKIMISSPRVIETCFDKYKTYKFIQSLGLQTPLTFLNLYDAKAALASGKIQYPLILKPRWGSGSIGLEFVDDEEEMEIAYKLLLKKVKKSILGTASVDDNYILIQQVIKGQEFGLDIMNNLDGEFQTVSVKRKLAMRSGETDKAITEDNPGIGEIGKKLALALCHCGILDCDILEKDGQYYVIDLNPRFGGGYPFSHEAGVNMPKAIIEWAKGKDVPVSSLSPRYGVATAKCDYLVNISID